jgi:hypothetical protein
VAVSVRREVDLDFKKSDLKPLTNSATDTIEEVK